MTQLEEEVNRHEANRKEVWLKAILESAAEISQLGRAARAHSDALGARVLGVEDMLLSDQRATEPQRERLEAFRRAVANLLRLVNNYLDLSNIESGQFELEKVDFDLKLVLEHTLDKLGAAARAKNLVLKLALVPGIPRTLNGDPIRLQQILANLLNNALQFADGGEIRVTAQPGEASACQVHFSVTFSGTGMPRDQRDGLGLCRTLLREMGGELFLRNAPGEAKAFTFDVRFAAGLAANVAKAQEVPAAKPELLKILIAEDSEDSRFLLQEFLKRGPYEVTFAENGKTAVEAALSRQFDLILMDIQMPVMDGLAATRLIRNAEQRAGRAPTPLLALTAHTRKADIDLSLAAGCNAHISKPISKSGLLETLQKYSAKIRVPAVPVGVSIPAGMEEAARRYILAKKNDVPRLRQMVEQREFDRLGEVARDLRGTGSSFGFPDLTRLGGMMESSAKSGNADDLAAQLLEMSKYVQEASAGVEVLLGK
jgi:CheY-like chemotaxis protein